PSQAGQDGNAASREAVPNCAMCPRLRDPSPPIIWQSRDQCPSLHRSEKFVSSRELGRAPVAQPSSAEKCDENKTGDDLSGNSIQKQATAQCRDKSNYGSKDWSANGSPGIAPTKDPPQYSVA